ncbi:MAG: DegT/DnrJ/EryC1/StrS family aminotransferase [Caldilineaceae bacterium]|nr:DegT/DnrJ/EryC1/StrS family aminotransferase [Caldilineaceae bacterium]
MTQPVPQCDPKANYLAHRAEIDAAVAAVLSSGWYILGKEVSAFEEEFARYIGVAAGIGVGSGTDALLLALRACGVGPGDGVITVSHTAVATVAAVEMAGATPILVDIDPVSFTLDVEKLADLLDDYPVNFPLAKAIVPVHLYGHPADLPAIIEIARRHNLVVIEDCAQSHGAAWDGRITGAWGDMAAFSFYPTKNLGALGDGGIVVTDRADLAERARLLRQYGWRQRYISEIPGVNSRLDEMQAAILRVKLRTLDAENSRRRQIAALYNRGLAGAGIELPAVRAEVSHVYHQYVARTPRRDELQQFLHGEGIGTLVHYPQPVHCQPAYRDRLRIHGELAQSERAAAEVLSLPIYAEMSDADAHTVVESIRRWAGTAK